MAPIARPSRSIGIPSALRNRGVRRSRRCIPGRRTRRRLTTVVALSIARAISGATPARPRISAPHRKRSLRFASALARRLTAMSPSSLVSPRVECASHSFSAAAHDRLEYRLDVVRRAADHAQDLGGRRLPLERTLGASRARRSSISACLRVSMSLNAPTTLTTRPRSLRTPIPRSRIHRYAPSRSRFDTRARAAARGP